MYHSLQLDESRNYLEIHAEVLLFNVNITSHLRHIKCRIQLIYSDRNVPIKEIIISITYSLFNRKIVNDDIIYYNLKSQITVKNNF